jgi:exosortase/archaeosortase family protein
MVLESTTKARSLVSPNLPNSKTTKLNFTAYTFNNFLNFALMKTFIIKLGVRVFLLYCLYLLLFKGINYISPGYANFISFIEKCILNNLLDATAWFLNFFSKYSVTHNADTLFLYQDYTLQITPNCLGIKLMWIFAILIIAYPGGPWKKKLWYIPAGFALLHLLNIARMIVLSYVIIYSNSFDFIHGFIFRILFYGTTFVLWYIWLKYFVKSSFVNEKENPSGNVI